MADQPELEAVVIAARAADSKGASSPVILQVGDILGITDAFLITSAHNPRLVVAVAEEIERVVFAATGDKPNRIEGKDDKRWVLLDYGDWVAHIFAEETRRYYDLERLWADVPRLDWVEAEALAAYTKS